MSLKKGTINSHCTIYLWLLVCMQLFYMSVRLVVFVNSPCGVSTKKAYHQSFPCWLLVKLLVLLVWSSSIFTIIIIFCYIAHTLCQIFHDGSGGLRFPTVGKLTKSLLSIPHSNADVERIFSHVNLIKVKQRNQLKI